MSEEKKAQPVARLDANALVENILKEDRLPLEQMEKQVHIASVIQKPGAFYKKAEITTYDEKGKVTSRTDLTELKPEFGWMESKTMTQGKSRFSPNPRAEHLGTIKAGNSKLKFIAYYDKPLNEIRRKQHSAVCFYMVATGGVYDIKFALDEQTVERLCRIVYKMKKRAKTRSVPPKFGNVYVSKDMRKRQLELARNTGPRSDYAESRD